MKIKWNMHILKINLSQTDHIEIWLILITKFGKLIQFWRNILQRSGCDKGRFWPNLRNWLYTYNIKHNHWKVRIFFFYDFTLSFVAYQRKWRRVQLIIGNSNMVVLFYILNAFHIKFSFGHKDFHFVNFIAKYQLISW